MTQGGLVGTNTQPQVNLSNIPSVLETVEDENLYVLQQVHVGENVDEDLVFEEVPVDDLIDDDDEDLEEDLEQAVRNINERNLITGKTLEGQQDAKSESGPTAKVTQRPEVVDDFFRNFLHRKGLFKTLNVFQNEWYEFLQKGLLRPDDAASLPDVYQQNQALEEQIKSLKDEVEKYKNIASQARSTFEKLKKERDFHRMHHKRLVQEKNRLVTQVKRWQEEARKFDPIIQQQKQKYETLMKEKMLNRLEKEKLVEKVAELEESLKQQILNPLPKGSISDASRSSTFGKQTKASTTGGSKQSSAVRNSISKHIVDHAPGAHPHWRDFFEEFPSDAFPTNIAQTGNTAKVELYQLRNNFKAHQLAIGAIKVHPKHRLVATVSDDMTWKLWSLPNGELVMNGEGHRDWIGDCDFHPNGSIIATASGDHTVKLWDLSRGQCVGTIADHVAAVWSCAYSYDGELLSTASMDTTARIWDSKTLKIKWTLRGHKDSINTTTFDAASRPLVYTGSADCTVSAWDYRNGLCVTTLYGHEGAVNHVTCSGYRVASCDALGDVRIWDIRTGKAEHFLPMGPHAANRISFDPSGEWIACASQGGRCTIQRLGGATVETNPSDGGHSSNRIQFDGFPDAVQAVAFERAADALLIAGSDGTLRLYSP